MTTFNLQNKGSTPSFTSQSKNSTSFTLQNRDMGKSLLLKEDGGLLTTEDGQGLILEQAVQGDAWVLQNKS